MDSYRMNCRNTPACPFPKGRFPEDTPLAMAYVPMQKFGKVYEPARGFQLGTIFPELCKPFCGKGGGCRR